MTESPELFLRIFTIPGKSFGHYSGRCYSSIITYKVLLNLQIIKIDGVIEMESCLSWHFQIKLQ